MNFERHVPSKEGFIISIDEIGSNERGFNG